jgi:hypothetical protein
MRGSAQARSWTIERITEAQVNMSEHFTPGVAGQGHCWSCNNVSLTQSPDGAANARVAVIICDRVARFRIQRPGLLDARSEDPKTAATMRMIG